MDDRRWTMEKAEATADDIVGAGFQPARPIFTQ